jgi:hypothetical protein
LKFKLIQLKSQNNFFDFRPTQLYYLYLRRACENLRDPPKNAADRPAQNMAGKPAKQARHRARRVNPPKVTAGKHCGVIRRRFF